MYLPLSKTWACQKEDSGCFEPGERRGNGAEMRRKCAEIHAGIARRGG